MPNSQINPTMSNSEALLALLTGAHERINRMLATHLTLQAQLDTLIHAVKAVNDDLINSADARAAAAHATLSSALVDVVKNRVRNETEDSIAQRLYSAHDPYGLLVEQPAETQSYWRRVARQIAPRINRLGQDAIEIGLRKWSERENVPVVVNGEMIADIRDEIVKAQHSYDPSLFCSEDPSELGMLEISLSDLSEKLSNRMLWGSNDSEGRKLDQAALDKVSVLRDRLKSVTMSGQVMSIPAQLRNDDDG